MMEIIKQHIMHRLDSQNMESVLDNFWKQCLDALEVGKKYAVDKPIKCVLICGMGGSALPGDIMRSYLNDSIPICINNDYHLPGWADKECLAFIISYSGNTEETISMYNDAKKKGCRIIVMANGGKLKDIAAKESKTFIELPCGMQPRDSIGYMVIPILNILMNSKLIPKNDDAKKMIDALRKDIKKKAEEIAEKLVNKIPIIYSSREMYAAARIWKIKMNENAKTQAFWNVFPELNHNEMVGFTEPRGNYYMIFIEDEKDDPKIKKRMMIAKKLMNEKGIPTLHLTLSGPNRLARIFSAVLLGSYVGYYLALKYGIDPGPVKMVEDFKKRLKD